jgi:predicted amidohydrolase YtcJ
LKAYTYGSAYASHKEDVLGSVSPGKFADFAVLDEDPHRVEPGALHEIAVTQTIIGGVVRYTRS